jgi:hypothetical protein
MTRSNILLIAIIFCLFLFHFETVQAKEIASGSSRVAFLHEWTLLGAELKKLRVEILRLAPRKGEVLPPFRMRILNGKEVLYSKDELGIEPLHIVNIDNDKLMVVWHGYSPFLFVRVFGFHDHKIVTLLKTGSRYYPELVYPADISENSRHNLDARIVTLTQADFFGKEQVPATATVYKWNREKFSYDSGISVDWNKRLLIK